MPFDNTDIFYGLATGNPVAWLAFVGIIGCISFSVFILILWWKMPQIAKTMFRNNFGVPGPIFAECYVNNFIKFIHPTLFRNGLAKTKNAWFVPPKLWATAEEDLKGSDIDLLTGVYNIEGAPGQFYLNYSLQAQVVSPKMAAFMQHEELLTKIKDAKLKPKIQIESFIQALKEMQENGEKYVELAVINLNLPVDIKALKTNLGRKSLSKSNMTELENKVRQENQGNSTELSKVTIAIILILITLLVSGVTLAKLMGLF